MQPSGEQICLSCGSFDATLAQVGASLRTMYHEGVELVSDYVEGEIAFYGEGQALVPWPNRIQDGRYQFEGHEHQLPLSEPEQRNAIHGLGRWLPWSIDSADEHHVRFSLRIHPQAGYPFSLSIEVLYTLSEDGLRVETTARNQGSGRLPYGCGFHPYFSLGSASVDEITLHVPASERLPVDERGIPSGQRIDVADTEFDFRTDRILGNTQLDTVFTTFERDEFGCASVLLRSAATAGVVRVWMDEHHPYLMLFTGDELPEGKQRTSIAVEPLTCAPNAFNNGEGLVLLSPGQRMVSAWGISVEA